MHEAVADTVNLRILTSYRLLKNLEGPEFCIYVDFTAQCQHLIKCDIHRIFFILRFSKDLGFNPADSIVIQVNGLILEVENPYCMSDKKNTDLSFYFLFLPISNRGKTPVCLGVA